ncbi:MAG: hypothetical protein HY518_05920 [Candidatus Aenigmarchaeota archaeon]|nr:hypothetical protein [Candidatus Aenigmarchaeota archaeon]
MGIEYATLIGIVILIFTAATSYQAGTPSIPQPSDLCYDEYGEYITCSDNCITCYDGSQSCCQNTCDPEHGTCSSCTPAACPAPPPPPPAGDGGSVLPKEEIEIKVVTAAETYVPAAKITPEKIEILENVEGEVHVSKIKAEQTLEIPVERETPGGAQLEFTPQKEEVQTKVVIQEVSFVEKGEIIRDFQTINKTVYTAFEIEPNFQASGYFFFTVEGRWIERFAGGDPEIVVLSQLDQNGSFKENVPTRLFFLARNSTGGVLTASYKSDLPRTFSLFVINAKEIVRGPSLCNNDGACIPPETETTCPGDCISEPPRSCSPGEAICIGPTIYTCASGEFLKGKKCTYGCSEGSCLEQGETQGFDLRNSLYIFLVIAVIAVAMVVAAVFLRRP